DRRREVTLVRDADQSIAEAERADDLGRARQERDDFHRELLSAHDLSSPVDLREEVTRTFPNMGKSPSNPVSPLPSAQRARARPRPYPRPPSGFETSFDSVISPLRRTRVARTPWGDRIGTSLAFRWAAGQRIP